MKTETVKGFQDFLGEEAQKREKVRKILVETFEKYGFNPAETPIVEYEEFVKGENINDEAVSDIFKLEDKGKRKLALRYEQTFSLKRIMNNKKLPFKRYTIGPVFRDEPVQGNRLRQFTQADVDIIGISESESREVAEILALTNELMNKLGIKAKILVNSRKLINEILKENGIKEKDFENVLKEIDKYGKIPESEIKSNLKKYKADKIIDYMKEGEKYFNEFPAYKEFVSLVDYCKNYGFKVLFSPSVVRGLSYYNGLVFEVKSEDIKETITAGGSFMFNGTQSTGISFGLDRLAIIAKIDLEKDDYLVVSLGQDREAIKLVQKLRDKDKKVSVFYGKPSKALDYANSYKIEKVIFVGEDEVKKKKFKVKDMNSGKESLLKI